MRFCYGDLIYTRVIHLSSYIHKLTLVFVIAIRLHILIGLYDMKYMTRKPLIPLRSLVIIASVIFFGGCNENGSTQPETIEPPIIIEPNEIHCPPQ